MAHNYKKIIEVASKLMSEKGYYGASMQMIADRIGISKSTIFHHFKNKEAILLAILEDAVPRVTYDLMLLAGDNSQSGKEKLKKFIKMQMKIVAEKGDILNIYLGESRHLNEQNKKIYNESRRAYTKQVRQIIKQVQEESGTLLKGVDTTLATNAILGMCNWAVTWYKKDGKLNIEEVSEELYRVIDPFN